MKISVLNEISDLFSELQDKFIELKKELKGKGLEESYFENITDSIRFSTEWSQLGNKDKCLRVSILHDNPDRQTAVTNIGHIDKYGVHFFQPDKYTVQTEGGQYRFYKKV